MLSKAYVTGRDSEFNLKSFCNWMQIFLGIKDNSESGTEYYKWE